MHRKDAFYQNRISGKGTWERPFDKKQRTALEADPAGPGIGYAKTYGNSRTRDCLGEVPGAKPMSQEVWRHTGGPEASSREDDQICFILKVFMFHNLKYQ